MLVNKMVSVEQIMKTNYSYKYSHFNCVRYIIILPVTVVVRSKAWVLAGWLLGSWVRIPLKAWMFVRVFLCCAVLCR
jgi:hypothetical protein